jgi:hypothetical protein
MERLLAFLAASLPTETPRPDDPSYTVVTGDGIDVLAHCYLGNVRLCWEIRDSNNISFPFDLQPGVVLRIPTPGYSM